MIPARAPISDIPITFIFSSLRTLFILIDSINLRTIPIYPSSSPQLEKLLVGLRKSFFPFNDPHISNRLVISPNGSPPSHLRENMHDLIVHLIVTS